MSLEKKDGEVGDFGKDWPPKSRKLLFKVWKNTLLKIVYYQTQATILKESFKISKVHKYWKVVIQN